MFHRNQHSTAKHASHAVRPVAAAEPGESLKKRKKAKKRRWPAAVARGSRRPGSAFCAGSGRSWIRSPRRPARWPGTRTACASAGSRSGAAAPPAEWTGRAAHWWSTCSMIAYRSALATDPCMKVKDGPLPVRADPRRPPLVRREDYGRGSRRSRSISMMYSFGSAGLPLPAAADWLANLRIARSSRSFPAQAAKYSAKTAQYTAV